MPPRCFRKKDTNPPLCGVHNVQLGQHRSSEHSAATKLGDFEFLVCPVSGQVVD
jgi:hypothetical protein